MSAQNKPKLGLVEKVSANPQMLAIFDYMHCGVALHSPDGTILYCNKAYRRLLGLESVEHIGKNVSDFFETAQQGALFALKEKEVVIGTTVTKGGVYGVAYRTPIVDENGELEGLLAELVTAGQDRDNMANLLDIILELRKEHGYYQWQARNQPGMLHTFSRIIGESAVMRKMRAAGLRFASGGQPILVTGESGTGKELVAQALHMAGARAQKPFIAVNCAALPHELIESELFGYGPGAFSGSKSGGMAGKFELADSGSIFLDEIGELPFSMQSKLLRVLESGEIQKLGCENSVYVDFRLIAATNKNLEKMVAEGKFREDLFHRLTVLELEVPPLRRRLDDIPLLAAYMLEQIAGFSRARELKISRPALELFQSHSWPGNVRELKNVLSFALYAMEGKEKLIEINHLPQRFLQGVRAGSKSPACGDFERGPAPRDLNAVIAHAERQAIQEALRGAGQNKSAAARRLGISRTRLYNKMMRHGLAAPDSAAGHEDAE